MLVAWLRKAEAGQKGPPPKRKEMNWMLIENEPENTHQIKNGDLATFKMLVSQRKRIKFHITESDPTEEMRRIAWEAGYLEYVLGESFRYFIHSSEVIPEARL